MIDDTQKVKQHYKDSRQLASRANLVRRYAEIGWYDWLQQRIIPGENTVVLDIGCGPGWYWQNLAAQGAAAGIQLTLSDLSYGMLTEARAGLAAHKAMRQTLYCSANAAALPFADNHFDAVIAMHMLYHVPDSTRAITEAKRVLREDGQLFITTNGPQNLHELFRLTADIFGGEAIDPVVRRFGFTHANEELAKHFSRVEPHILSDIYRITDPADIIAYLTSFPPGSRATASQMRQLRKKVQERFEAGAGIFEATRDVGLFVAHNR